ncbi:hypothetical protein ACWGOQ_0008055 [Aquimarina sp. M1]
MLDFLNEANWWCLLLLLLIAFLLGWFLSKWSLKNKYQEKLNRCLREKEKLRSSNFQKANTTFVPPISVETHDTEKAITSGKTETFAKGEEKPTLNFESFGRADASQKDNLKLISGVGPFIEKKLNSIGIFTFDQISRFTKEDIDTVTDLIQFFPGRIERDNWTAQAEKLKNKSL